MGRNYDKIKPAIEREEMLAGGLSEKELYNGKLDDPIKQIMEKQKKREHALKVKHGFIKAQLPVGTYQHTLYQKPDNYER